MGFTDHPALKGFIGRLMPEWAEVTRFRKQLMRTNIPHAYKSATRVHYDQMWVGGIDDVGVGEEGRGGAREWRG